MRLLEIYDYKEIYENEDIVRIVSHALFNPTPGKVQSLAQGVYGKQQGKFYTAILDDKIIGIVGIKRIGAKKVEIMHIAVDEPYRGKGLGKQMIQELITEANPKEIFLETDNDGVHFYRKCGFKTKKLPDQGFGTDRFLCTLYV